MKKLTPLITFSLQPAVIKSFLLTVIATVALFSGYAINYYTVTGATDANNPASWTTNNGGGAGTAPANFTTAGDVFNLRNGQSMSLTANLDLGGNTFNIVGTGSLNCQGFILSGTAGSIFNLSATGTLKIGSADGITTAGTAAGSIQTDTRNYVTGGNAGIFEYNAASGDQVTGSGLPATNVLGITINTATGTQVVTLTRAGTTSIGSSSSQSVGSLILTQGIFKIGAANTIEFTATQGGGNVTSNGGTIASTGTNGEDGGTILTRAANGGGFLVGGTTTTTFYNFTFVQNANLNMGGATPSFVINGTFTIPNNNWSWGSNAKSPIYGPASTLSVNRNDQVLPTSNGLEWVATPTATPTIGVTPGYPNNVILITTSNSGAWNQTGNRGLNGTLTLNSNTRLNLSGITGSFNVGGSIVLNGGSILTGPTGGNIIIKGNWSRASTATFTHNGSTLVLAGAGTTGTPQTINVSTGIENQLGKITVDNGTYVKLLSPVTLPAATGVLALNAGILETDATNVLTVNNNAVAAIVGGSATSFINGPVKWSTVASGAYSFPVGKATTYLPFGLVPASANTATVEAFNVGSGGTPDNVTVTSLSATEYWSISTSGNYSSGISAVSVSRPTPVAPFNAIAKSSSATGVYTAVGGTASGNSVNNSNGIGTNSPWFFSLGVAPLAVIAVNVVIPTCANGNTGSLTVQGSGGTAPYTYQIGNGAFSSNNVFTGLTEGDYVVTVKDATSATATATFTVPSAIALNKDTTVCTGSSVNLAANSTVASNFTWTANTTPAVAGLSGTTGGAVTATPTATTTYTVSADIVTNLLQNPGFEDGNTAFASNYIYLSGNQIPYNDAASVPAVGSSNHNGIYAIVPNSNNLCNFFNNPIFQDHTSGSGLMFVSDGPSNGNTGVSFWSQTISGLTPNTNYVFSYWVRNAGNSAPQSQIRTQINSVDLPAGTSTNPYTSTAAWSKVSYSWNSGASTSAAISLYDNVTADVGNDFAVDDLEFLSTCQVTKTVTVTVVNVATGPTVTTVQPTCSVATGSITVTNASTGLTYSFDNGVTYQAEATKSGLTPGTYQVVIKTTGGCISAPSAVTIDPVPTGPIAPVAAPTQPTCSVATGSITVSNPTTDVTYSFDNGVTYQAEPTKSGLTPGTYQVVVKTTAGCVSVATAITITNAPTAPGAPIATAAQPTCTTATGSITVSNPTTGVTYSFDNGVTYQAEATRSGLASGTYQVVVKSEGGCVSAPSQVTINQQPVAPVVSVGNDTTITTGSTITITGTTTIEGTYLWTSTPATQIASPTSLSTQTSPGTSTTYQLEVTTAAGCKGTDQKVVTIQNCPPVNPPNAFTPNNDGYWDKWNIGDRECITRMQVDVYNRWGGQVYHSDDYNNNWDGTYKGKPVPDGTYYYVIRVTTSNGTVQVKKGNVTIIR